MTSESTDHAIRERALDVSRSFIVQAPAGSGKTELLIRRYLTLLQTVEQPEQVVAITFTRKAAAEMRGRVTQTLREASSVSDLDGSHRAVSLRMAGAVLAKARQLDWGLLSNPQRIRIDTLDAMNSWLAQQLPLLSGGVAGADVAENAAHLYRLAARRTLDRLSGPDDLNHALQPLLAAVDNSVDRLEALLAAVLPSRDQWLRHMLGDSDDEFLARLTHGLKDLCAEHVSRLQSLIPPAAVVELPELLRHAAIFAERQPLREVFDAWNRSDDLAGVAPAALNGWRAAAALLLSSTGQWRRRLTKSEGFGPKHAEQTRALAAVIAGLEANEELRAALAQMQDLPEPGYTPQQCRDLLALRRVLPHTVAELRVLFAEQETVDFVELAMAAEQALGQIDEPSELLLAIDRRIQHLLVDEFQDTSHAQFRLLELLTSGWSANDGRSLFLVGDPMQSIYRFRDADMSLFLRAKQRGVGQIKLDLLVLETNFRCVPAIVGWTNEVFARVLPDRDNVDTGAARFYPSVAIRAATPAVAVHMHALTSDSPDAEIAKTIEILRRHRAERPTESIGILVQSRTHLRGLLTQLRLQGLAARAVEIESLAETEIGQDLIGLTRALAHLGDRIAWLAVLRAPWCGLGWADLHSLCAGADDLTIWESLHEPARVAALSPDAQQRLLCVRTTLRRVWRMRSQHTFANWIEHAWRMLDGPSCLDRQEDAERASQFFADLNKIVRRGDLDDPAELDQAFFEPHAQADPSGEAGIEIMTIHRAKGLEFDIVILLGLAKHVRGPDPQALHWHERWSDQGGARLLLAPLSADKNRLTSYLQRVEQQRELAERGRLLYVATTRARDRLHLVAQLGSAQREPPRGTLLDLLWPNVAEQFEANGRRDRPSEHPRPALTPLLSRFAGGFADTDPQDLGDDPPAVSIGATRPEFVWAGQTAVQVGTVVHHELQVIADTDPDSWDSRVIDARVSLYRRDLAMLGVTEDELERSAQRVCVALQRVIADPRGQWILAAHAEARSELQLTISNEHRLEHIRLDRTFVDNGGTRWIVDYKTSAHEGGNMAAFLDSEVVRYKPQLERYAAAMAAIDSKPIRVGLYFPLLAEFREWEPATVRKLRGC